MRYFHSAAVVGTPSSSVSLLTGEATEDDEGDYVLGLRASPDGTRVAAIVSDFTVRVHRATQRKKAAAALPPLAHLAGVHRARITDATWINDACIVTCDEAGAVYRWDVATSAPSRVTDCGGSAAYALAVGCGATLLAVGSEATITFFDIASGRRLGLFEESHTERVVQLLFHPTTPTHLYSCSEDGLVCLFDVSVSGEENALLCVANVECAIERIGLFGASFDHIWVVSQMETFCVWHFTAEESTIVADRPRMRDDLAAVGSAAAYLLGATLDPATQQLCVLSGDRSGRVSLTALQPGGGGAGALVPIASLAGGGGHRATVRCFVQLGAMGGVGGAGAGALLVTGGEDAQLCAWGSTPPPPPPIVAPATVTAAATAATAAAGGGAGAALSTSPSRKLAASGGGAMRSSRGGGGGASRSRASPF